MELTQCCCSVCQTALKIPSPMHRAHFRHFASRAPLFTVGQGGTLAVTKFHQYLLGHQFIGLQTVQLLACLKQANSAYIFSSHSKIIITTEHLQLQYLPSTRQNSRQCRHTQPSSTCHKAVGHSANRMHSTFV